VGPWSEWSADTLPAQWAIDLGTTNTVVAVAESGNVRVVPLSGLTREQPVEQSPLIPTAVHVRETERRWLFFCRLALEVSIGQPALYRNTDGRSPGFVRSFKRYLGSQPHRPAAREGRIELSVREVTRRFLQELLRTVRRQSGQRVTSLTIPAPVGFYESYRAELQALAHGLGLRSFRSLDEPIAAALGYGVNVAREETLLVVDFGGGTLNLAVIRLSPQTMETGAAVALAKHMVALGGDDVDRWLMEHFVPVGLDDLPEWQQDLRWEAMWVKERMSQTGCAEFRWGGLRRPFTREEFVRLLAGRGLYDQVRAALGEIQAQLGQETASAAVGLDEVLLVGGSTLLPEVAAVVDEAFPRAVVRHDPEYVFTAVALGAARFASGVPLDDFVYHDYALAVQNEETHTVDYELLVPRRTRYPTPRDFAVRYYADYPGMSEVRFNVCEVGRLGQEPVSWRAGPNGNSYWTPRTEQERGTAVALNPTDAPLPLRPAGQGASPRLRVTYAVDADRWLCVTIEDLVRKQRLRANEPVARLR
jgi:molecular chaperone DnaK (HSP70)